MHSFNKRLKLDQSTKWAIKSKKPKESSSDSDESGSYSVNDDTDLDFNFADYSSIEQVDAEHEDEACIDLSYDHLNPGDYILVECSNKNNNKILGFVGQINEKDGNMYNVSFLKKKPGSYRFFYPDIEDKWSVSGIEIKAKLPPPINPPGTSRTAAMMTFAFDFSKFQLG